MKCGNPHFLPMTRTFCQARTVLADSLFVTYVKARSTSRARRTDVAHEEARQDKSTERPQGVKAVAVTVSFNEQQTNSKKSSGASSVLRVH
jgi:hypothetical protein